MSSVSACLIVKNEAHVLEQTIASYREHVAEVCVYDTGSTDGTLELFDRLAAEPGAPIIVERGVWTDHFADARAKSLAMASNDWILYMDADEELIGGEHLADNVVRAEANGVPQVITWYAQFETWSKRRPHYTLWGGPRLFRLESGAYEGMVHETWRLTGGGEWPYNPAVWICGDRIAVHHHRPVVKAERYLPMIERAAADPAGTNTPRALLHLGKTLFGVGRYAEAIVALRSYLAGGWNDIEGEPNSLFPQALETLQQALWRSPDGSTLGGVLLMRWAQRLLDAYEELVPWRLGEPEKPGGPLPRFVDIHPADGWLPRGLDGSFPREAL